MRITRFSLAGLAIALVGAAAEKAAADNLTIPKATTTPVRTSQPAGGTPGDVTIAASGSITVTAGQTAVTVDSDNDVSNVGTITSNDANDVLGMLLQGGFAGPQVISNSGSINLVETAAQTDTDGDGNLDGPVATGANRHAIRLQAGAAFNGSVQNSGSIFVEGNNSSGIRLDAQLIGNLQASSGQIVVNGTNSTGIHVNAGMTGDAVIGGSLVGRGEGARGLVVENGAINGRLIIGGAISTTGYNNTLRPATQAQLDALDPDDLLQGGSAALIRSSVSGGILVRGVGVEDDTDDDGDGLTEAAGDTDDDAGGAVRSFGAAPALHIQSQASAINIGPTSTGWGLHLRGLVEGGGVYNGVTSTAVRTDGQAGAGVTIANGILADNRIVSNAYEANAYGIYVGGYTTTPTIINRGSIETTSISEAARTAYGIYIAPNASVASIDNRGTINTYVQGEIGTAAAITDQSNTLTSLTNSGVILATLVPTDSNLNDDIEPVATGPAIAVDASTNTVGLTLNQIADTPFTDDDSVDDDASVRPAPSITGAVRLGAGADTVNLLAGSLVGDLSFGAGADALTINNGATFSGRLSDADGALTINVINGDLLAQGGTVNITSASFGANSELGVLMSSTPANATRIIASGTVSFAAGAIVTPLIPAGLPVAGSHIFLTANGGLIGGANVERVVTGSSAPFVYNLEVEIAPGAPNSLQAIYALKSPAELGLTANEGAAFLPIIAALRSNDGASTALAGLLTQAEFADAYDDLLPSFSSGAAELAATAIQQAQGAASNRLATTRLHGLDEVSVWVQEIGYALNREAPTANGQSFEGQGFGLAIGIDGPLENGAMFGLSTAFVTSEVEEEGRPDGELSATFGQINAYLGTALGAIDLDLVGGVGAGRMNARRFVEIGPNFSAQTEAEWWAYEGHLAARAAAPMALTPWFIVTPQAALTYVAMQEDGYAEEGGGAAINYEADDAFSQRLWGDVGVEFSTRFNLRGNGVIAPRLFAGYRSNLISDPAERSFSFAGGTPFTLIDDEYDDGAPLVGIGLDGSNGYSTFSLSYEGEFGDQIERHSLNASIRFRF